MMPVLDGDWLEDGQFVVSIANSDVTTKRSEVDRRTFERASSIIVNDWESVFDNDQTELLGPLKEGAIRVAARRRPADIVSGPMPIKWERAPHSTFTRTSTASAGRWKT
jgi:ornithine cyclodeaminase/alanine dehydrogenase-like protein (mu-crystallin family)